MDHFDNVDVSDDSSPYLTARSTLIELDDQLESYEVETLKFLCAKLLSASKLEKVKRGVHLFENLELLWGFKIRHGQLDPNFVRNIAELLYLIQRNDLLEILEYNVKKIKTEVGHYGSNIDDFCFIGIGKFPWLVKMPGTKYFVSFEYKKYF